MKNTRNNKEQKREKQRGVGKDRGFVNKGVRAFR